MRMLLLALVSACAAGYGAPGPGASNVTRVNGPGAYVDATCTGWCPVYLQNGYVRADGPGLKFMFGAKLGVTDGGFAGRERAIGIGSEPHVDLTWVSATDRWAVTATAGYVFQSLYYPDDTVSFRGFTPSASFHWGLRRRLYIHAGVGHSFGTIELAPEAADDGMTASLDQHRGLAGLTFVFRRTPTIDFALRLEANAYVSGNVTIGSESGRMSGWGLTFEGLLSRF